MNGNEENGDTEMVKVPKDESGEGLVVGRDGEGL